MKACCHNENCFRSKTAGGNTWRETRCGSEALVTVPTGSALHTEKKEFRSEKNSTKMIGKKKKTLINSGERDAWLVLSASRASNQMNKNIICLILYSIEYIITNKYYILCKTVLRVFPSDFQNREHWSYGVHADTSVTRISEPPESVAGESPSRVPSVLASCVVSTNAYAAYQERRTRRRALVSSYGRRAQRKTCDGFPRSESNRRNVWERSWNDIHGQSCSCAKLTF